MGLPLGRTIRRPKEFTKIALDQILNENVGDADLDNEDENGSIDFRSPSKNRPCRYILHPCCLSLLPRIGLTYPRTFQVHQKLAQFI